MKKATKRLLSFLLVFVMMFSILPTTAFAAGEEKPEEITLQLGDEYGFELKDSDDEISFRFTAKEAGTYIFYFRHLTRNPISISWNKENIEYYHEPANGHFEGRVVELENDGKFDPSGKLTRQQMAAFFFRFAQYAEMDVEVRGDISGMLNADKVSGYAKESVE